MARGYCADDRSASQGQPACHLPGSLPRASRTFGPHPQPRSHPHRCPSRTRMVGSLGARDQGRPRFCRRARCLAEIQDRPLPPPVAANPHGRLRPFPRCCDPARGRSTASRPQLLPGPRFRLSPQLPPSQTQFRPPQSTLPAPVRAEGLTPASTVAHEPIDSSYRKPIALQPTVTVRSAAWVWEAHRRVWGRVEVPVFQRPEGSDR